LLADGGTTIAIATGPVIVDVYAHTPALAHAAAEAVVPINFPGSPGSRLAAPRPNTGFGGRPLPAQVPLPLKPLH
jgi:hypothetical protein